MGLNQEGEIRRGAESPKALEPDDVLELDEAFDRAVSRMSPEEKKALDQRLAEISEMFGSGGP